MFHTKTEVQQWNISDAAFASKKNHNQYKNKHTLTAESWCQDEIMSSQKFMPLSNTPKAEKYTRDPNEHGEFQN